MKSTILTLIRLVQVLLILVVTRPLAAADPTFAGRVVDLPTERRILISLGKGDPTLESSVSPLSDGVTIVRLPKPLTLHRFRAVLVDGAGRPSRAGVDWSLHLSVTGNRSEGSRHQPMEEPLVRLTAADPELRIPRPYGIRVAESDSLLIVVSLRTAEDRDGISLLLLADYDVPANSVARLPAIVLPSREVPRSELVIVKSDTSRATGAPAAWTWHPTVDGRLLAISGHQLACADELVLEEMGSGAVLWRLRLASPVPSLATGQQSEIIRPGVAVKAGRTYRLRAAFAGAGAPCGAGVPTAVVFPVVPPTA